MKRSPARFVPELTGIRGVAALLVFLHHGEKWIPGMPFGLRDGGLGVLMFFTLSGYLITRTYFQRIIEGFSYREYWIKRFARIFPAYLFVLLLKTWVAGEWASKPALQWFANLTLTQGLFHHAIFTGLDPNAWSLTVEECFYLAAPPLFLLLAGPQDGPARTRRLGAVSPARVIAILVALSLGLRFAGQWIWEFENWVFGGHNYLITRMWSLFYEFSPFAIGIGLALAVRTSPAETERKPRKLIAEALFLGSLGLGIAPFLIFSHWRESLHFEHGGSHPYGYAPSFLFAAATALLIHSVSRGSRFARWTLGNPVAVYLGKISYVSYLLNAQALFLWIHSGYKALVGPEGANNPLFFYLFFSGAAALIYHAVEKPFHARILELVRSDRAQSRIAVRSR